MGFGKRKEERLIDEQKTLRQKRQRMREKAGKRGIRECRGVMGQ